jgi:hypothetical protein
MTANEEQAGSASIRRIMAAAQVAAEVVSGITG